MMARQSNSNRASRCSVLFLRFTWMLSTMSSLFFLSASISSVHALEKDMNVYPFGSNPNDGNRLYFPDGASVLRNLDQFAALHVRFHNCAWSPNIYTTFDDDGEYHDGEDAWYEGRASSGHAANAGFTLYGHLKRALPRLGVGACRKATYINSFFTNNGAEVLITALGLNVDTSYNYCHEYSDENNNNNNNNNNNGGSQDNNGDDGNNNAQPQSATLGCTADGKFATALFTDQYCQGRYFLNATTADQTYASYNSKLSSVHCHKIWNGDYNDDNYNGNGNNNNNNDDDQYGNNNYGYSSLAHEILLQSNVCDTAVHAQCPNPWRKKSRYEHKFALAGANRTVMADYRIRRPLVTAAHLVLVAAAVLTMIAYRGRNKKRLQELGWLACLQQDVPRFFKKRSRSVRRIWKDYHRKERRRQRGGDGGNSSNNNKNNPSQTFSDDTWDNDPTIYDDDEGDDGGGEHEESWYNIRKNRSKKSKSQKTRAKSRTVELT